MDFVTAMLVLLSAGLFGTWGYVSKSAGLSVHMTTFAFASGVMLTSVLYSAWSVRAGHGTPFTWRMFAIGMLAGVLNAIATISVNAFMQRGDATVPLSIMNVGIFTVSVLAGVFVFEGTKLDYRHGLMILFVLLAIASPTLLPAPAPVACAPAPEP